MSSSSSTPRLRAGSSPRPGSGSTVDTKDGVTTTSQHRGSGQGCIRRLELQRNLGRIAAVFPGPGTDHDMAVYEPGDLRFQAKNLIFRAKAFFRHHRVSGDIVRAKRMAAKGRLEPFARGRRRSMVLIDPGMAGTGW